jgi:hypothetical protein
VPGDVLLAAFHDGIHEPGYQDIAVNRVR